MNKRTTKISIIGLGHFGKFWAEQLSNYFDVHCFDSDKSKLIDLECKVNVSTLEECLKMEYVFITIPIREIEAFFAANRNKFISGTTIVDCASVKVEVLKWGNDHLPGNVNHISMHPLFGPDSAKAGLKGHTIVYTNKKFSDGPIFNTLSKDIGIEMQLMSPEDHDLMMAYNLNLVHLLGRTLNDLELSLIPIKMRGIKYLEEITKFVMNDNKKLFQDFFTYNAYAKSICENFANSFNKITSELNIGEELKLNQIEV